MLETLDSSGASTLAIALAAVCIAMAAAGCTTESNDDGVCDPGEVQTCPCPVGGGSGTQSCADGGQSWNACDCSFGGDTGQHDASDSGETSSDSVDDTDTNRAPTAPAVNITPEQPAGVSPLSCHILASSVDSHGDDVTYRYRWMVDGQDAGVSQWRVDPSRTEVGQEWRCEVVASDGVADSAPGTDSVTVTGSEQCPTASATANTLESLQPQTELQTTLFSTVELDGSSSSDPDGSDADLRYEWTLVSRPPNSSAELSTTSVEKRGLYVDVVGTYQIELEVFDVAGNPNCGDPAMVTVEVVPGDGIVVQLTWDTPADDDQTDRTGTDLDLHYLNPEGTWKQEPWDAHFRNPNPDWGVPNDESDDPLMPDHDSDGADPESVVHRQPVDRVYVVGVYYYSDREMGFSDATVRIYIDGTQAFEQTERLSQTGIFWHVATVDWTDRSVTEIGQTRAGFPP